jgi:hypothetical protein
MNMRKLSLEQANELLALLGLQDVDVVASLEDGEEPLNVQEIAETLKPAQPEPFDKGELLSQHTGKLMGSIYSEAARAFGIKRSDLEGLKEKDLFPKLKQIVDSRYSPVEQNLRAELEAAIKERDELEDKLRGEYQSEIESIHSQYEEKDILNKFLSTYNSIPVKGGDLSQLAEMALMKAKSSYNVRWNKDRGEVEFYEKGDDTKRALSGKDVLDAKAFIANFNKIIGNEATGTQHIEPANVLNNKNLTVGVATVGSDKQPANEYEEGAMRLLQQVEEKMQGA